MEQVWQKRKKKKKKKANREMIIMIIQCIGNKDICQQYIICGEGFENKDIKLFFFFDCACDVWKLLRQMELTSEW